MKCMKYSSFPWPLVVAANDLVISFSVINKDQWQTNLLEYIHHGLLYFTCPAVFDIFSVFYFYGGFCDYSRVSTANGKW